MAGHSRVRRDCGEAWHNYLPYAQEAISFGLFPVAKRILIIEREYGCGAAEVAEKAAQRLGWHLLDRELTNEIARMARVSPAECARHEERVDSWLYRLGKTFWRGSYETSLSLEGSEVLDADCMMVLFQKAILKAAEAGECVIVGRGAPYFLRNRPDTFCVFLYAPRHFKLRRLQAQLGDAAKADQMVDSVDQGRAEFIRHYFGREWPVRHLYHMMVNTVIGLGSTVDLILNTMNNVRDDEATRLDLD